MSVDVAENRATHLEEFRDRVEGLVLRWHTANPAYRLPASLIVMHLEVALEELEEAAPAPDSSEEG
ncbi:hypothetical protein [Nonomuraea sp. NPDC050202]|uniref:hypothetical protein n=1 Tax=Nonomuraea sp. NPDC050202 TaxID=3155035 RepID=UPI0033F43270